MLVSVHERFFCKCPRPSSTATARILFTQHVIIMSYESSHGVRACGVFVSGVCCIHNSEGKALHEDSSLPALGRCATVCVCECMQLMHASSS